MELMSQASVQKALQHLQAGFQADCRQQYKSAALQYMEGAPLLLQAARDEGLSTQVKQFIKTRCQLYLDRIQAIKAGLDSGKDEEIPANTAVERTQPNMSGFDDYTREAILAWTDIPLKCSLDDVKGCTQAKEFLWTNIILPLLCPGLPSSTTKVKRGVLLYGLPGTGKTLLLGAVAAAVACPVLRVTACDLINNRYGPEAMVQTLKDIFTWARQNQPCVLCLDDLDVLYNPDNDAENTVTRMVREELILQLTPISADNQVIVIGATQRPWHLGGKLQRKFDRRFYLTLPESEERAQIFSEQMTGTGSNLTKDDLDKIGQLTAGFTGSDVTVLVKSCLMQPVRMLQKATHFRKVSVTKTENGRETTEEMLSPCDSDSPGAIPITLEFLNTERIQVPTVTMEMVENELKDIKHSCSEAEVDKMNKWAEEFGQQ